MATLAYVTSASQNTYPTTYSSRTVSLNVGSASDRFLIVLIDRGGASINSVTYAGSNLTKYADYTSVPTGNMELWYMDAPTANANDFVITWSASVWCVFTVVAYSGAKQASFPNQESSVQTGTSANPSVTMTPDKSNCWGILILSTDANPSSSTNCTNRTTAGAGTQLGDTNGVISGSTTMVMHEDRSVPYWAKMFVLAATDSASSGPANLKSRSGNLKANIKSMSGNLIANDKSLSGNS